MITEREFHLDNIKILLLFLVALAHNLIPFKDTGMGIELVIKAIYLFHMPLFAYVTGYLVRRSKRNIWGYIKKLLIPYVVFQLLYVGVGTIMIQIGAIDYSTNTMTLSIIEPSGPLYFMVCMIVWRLLCPVFEQIKSNKYLVTAILVLIAIIISFDPYGDTIIMPIFALLPFYYLGYNIEILGGHNKHRKLWIFVEIMIYIIAVCIVPYSIILFRVNMWELDISMVQALICKCLYYPIALCGILFVKAIVPKRYIKGITNRTKNGMIIYIGSSFLAPYLYIVLYSLFPILQNSLGINIIAILCFTVFVIWFCSWNCWMKLYNLIFGRITS